MRYFARRGLPGPRAFWGICMDVRLIVRYPISALLAMIVILVTGLATPSVAMAAGDPAPIVATSVSWSTSSVDVTAGPATVRVVVGMDPVRNLGTPNQAWLRSSVSTQVSTGLADPTPWTSADERTFTFTLPQGAAPGQWVLDFDALYVDEEYHDVVPPSGARSSIDVTSIDADLEAPVLHSLEVTPNPVDITYEARFVRVTARVTDRTDASVRLFIHEADGARSSLHLSRVGETDMFTNQFVVWTGSPTGKWSASIEFLQDALGNHVGEPALPTGVNGDFTVVSPPSPPGLPRITYLAAWARGSFTAAWERPYSDGGSPITGYEATLVPSGKVLRTDADTLTTTFTGLEDGTQQTLRVSAINALGTGAFAEYGPTRTWTVPLAPAAPVASPRRTLIDVSWKPPAPNASGPLSGYEVTAHPSGQTMTVGATATTATFSGLAAAAQHTFSVAAINTVGTGSPSARSAPVALVTEVAAPVLTATLSAPDTAKLTWTFPAGVDEATSYEVCRRRLDGTTISCLTPTARTVSLGALPADRTFGFAVRAHDGTQWGPWSQVRMLTTTPGVGRGFTPVAPRRLVDTRTGLGASPRLVKPGETLTFPVPGLPSGTTSVTLNLTGLSATAGTYITAHAADAARPTASHLNLLPGETVASFVSVPVSKDGRVSLFNARGSVNLLVDLAGYVHPGGPSTMLSEAGNRILDTRHGTGAARSPVGAGELVSLTVPKRVGQVPTAAVLNLTVTGATRGTYVTAYPAGMARPNSSSLNVPQGGTVANLVVVPLDSAGRVNLWNAAGSVELIADLVGTYSLDTGAGYEPVAPTRIMDTRSGLGGSTGLGSTLTSLKLPNLPLGAKAVLLRTTVVGPSRGGNLVGHPAISTSTGSILNFAASQTVGNHVVLPVQYDGTVRFQLSSGVQGHLLVDVAGYYRR